MSFHQLSRRSNFSFDIFKKTVDVGKDVLRTHATWLSFFNRYLPLLGLSIALISFGLQAAVIIFDPKIDRDTKVANGLFFSLLCTLTLLAFIASASAPTVAIALALGIAVLNFSADAINFVRNSKSLIKNKQSLKIVNNEQLLTERRQSLDALTDLQNKAINKLTKNLLTLIAASQANDPRITQAVLDVTEDCMQELIEIHYQLTELDFPKKSLEQAIRQQQLGLNISALSLCLNVMSIALLSFSLITATSMPIGFSVLLLLNLSLDVIDLCKNIYTNYQFEQRQLKQNNKYHALCEKYTQTAIESLITLKKIPSSYRKILDKAGLTPSPTTLLSINKQQAASPVLIFQPIPEESEDPYNGITKTADRKIHSTTAMNIS